MRPTPWIEAEHWRITRAPGYPSIAGDRFGIFSVPANGIRLLCMVGGGDDEVPWEHVSVSTERRVPNWYEMCRIKDLFWEEHEAVMQLHPPKRMHINCHPHTLHLWRPMMVEIPMPPLIAV